MKIEKKIKKLIGITPTKKFYLGFVVIFLIGVFFGVYSNNFVFAVLLPLIGVMLFIDLELINLLVKQEKEELKKIAKEGYKK